MYRILIVDDEEYIVNSLYYFFKTQDHLELDVYKSYDVDWKSINEVLFWIVEIASKGGNYLLNVGPDGNGVIPKESVDLLKQVGLWMNANGEAIYGTGKWTTLKEGPTSLEMKSTGERAKKGFTTKFTPEDFWFTVKSKNVYAISLVPPANGKVKIKSLASGSNMIKTVNLVGYKQPLKWKVNGDALEIDFPKDYKNTQYGFVIKTVLK
jgi:alpha-L-fucosidase